VHPRLLEILRIGTIPELFGLGPFDVGPLTIYTYGVMLAAAYLLGLQLAIVRARRAGLDSGRVLDLGVYLVIAALLGAKFLLLFVNFGYFRSNPGEIFVLLRSGGVFYGGLIGATLVAFWYIRRHGLPLWTTCDMFAPGIALGHVVGRLGCLLAGCCYGKPTSVPWAITFTDPFAAANVGTPLNIPLHPTQIYEAGAELLILVFLLMTERRGRRFPGRTFWGYMFLYAVSRFAIEFYRGDERGIIWGLSTSQSISLIIAPLSLVMLLLLRRRIEPRAPARTARRAA
jgi:phosphatidylglycerol:prolipoprotein diacylglycerol transferase